MRFRPAVLSILAASLVAGCGDTPESDPEPTVTETVIEERVVVEEVEVEVEVATPLPEPCVLAYNLLVRSAALESELTSSMGDAQALLSDAAVAANSDNFTARAEATTAVKRISSDITTTANAKNTNLNSLELLMEKCTEEVEGQ